MAKRKSLQFLFFLQGSWGGFTFSVCTGGVIEGKRRSFFTFTAPNRTIRVAHEAEKREPKQLGAFRVPALMKVKPSRSCLKPLAARLASANLPPPTCLSPQRYTSEWHRLSHSGLRRCVRVCARTSKLHSTHLLIVLKGEKEKDRRT